MNICRLRDLLAGEIPKADEQDARKLRVMIPPIPNPQPPILSLKILYIPPSQALHPEPLILTKKNAYLQAIFSSFYAKLVFALPASLALLSS